VILKADQVSSIIFAASVQTFWERIIPILISIFSAGLGYWLVYPIFAFNHYQRAAERLKLPGIAKVEFKGDLVEFWKIYVWNGLLTCVTFGFYNFLGYAENNITRYVDHHLKFIHA